MFCEVRSVESVLTAKQTALLRAKAARKARVRVLNEPPRLTAAEEVFNAASHGIGAALALAAMVLLLARSDGALEVMASCFYGISLFVMMLMSALYHAMPAGSVVKRLWRRFDYASIYLLIGGTFAPILLVYYGNTMGITMFCIQWGVILTGIALIAIFGPGKWRPLHFTLYFLIGWSGLMFLPDFYLHSRRLLWFILAGGLVYTLGMIPFARNQKWDHCFWHVLVLAAAAIHWLGIYTLGY